ncbi:DUF882 domain-containing protein [Haliea sp. E17]|uniref:DUF882 domain-containing protein n=1 Tax=Haliea sp. E17 TaxID=3401576 RepID=UPI003AAF1ABF
MKRHLNRRHFLRGLTAGAALASTGLPTLARAAAASGQRLVAMHNLHTGESLEAAYWADGALRPEVLVQVNQFLRDHRTGDVHSIDTDLLDQMYQLQRASGVERPFEIISGYRSPATNASLHNASSGVAVKSLHMQGKAIDIRLPGVRLAQLRDSALSLQAGGVGYYAQSDFIHIDTGRVRRW